MKGGVLTALMLAVLTLVLAGCTDTVRIGELVADPGRWTNKTVRVVGTVQNSMGGLGYGAYAVTDDTGTVWVINRRGTGTPSRGARVGVQGKVFQGVTVFGQSFGVAIQEERHRTQ